MKTLELLASLFDKGLITMNFESEDVVKAEDEVIPVKETGWYAMRSPIYGDRNIAFTIKLMEEKILLQFVGKWELH